MNNLFLKSKGSITDFTNIDWKMQDSDHSTLLFVKNSKKVKEYFDKYEPNCHHLITDSHEIFDAAINASLVKCENFLIAQKKYLDQIYPHDPKKIIAITGTNGKTTTTSLVDQILRFKEKKTLWIGTLGVSLNGSFLENFKLTTPAYIDLRKCLYKYNHEFEYLIVEASSHALDQDRFFQLKFNSIAWTNLTQDHLDYHVDFKNYFDAKFKIIDSNCGKDIKIFHDQVDLIEKVKERSNVNIIKQNLSEENIELLSDGLKLNFNIQNLNLAKSLVEDFIEDISWNEIYSKLELPDGRVNFINWNNRSAIIDFAHTPDALEKITANLKLNFPSRRLITLFGCGGDRDRSKRPLMLKAAMDYSDQVVLTSDNPRTEDPERIIEDALVGCKDTSEVRVIVDRALAIKGTIEIMLDGDILLIAGKGHEKYILKNNEVIDYSDREEVEKNI